MPWSRRELLKYYSCDSLLARNPDREHNVGLAVNHGLPLARKCPSRGASVTLILVRSESHPAPTWRSLTAEDVQRAIGQIKGATGLREETLGAIARSFQVQDGPPIRLHVERRQVGAIGIAAIGMSAMRIHDLPFSRSHTVHLGFVLTGSVTMTPRDGDALELGPGDVSMITNWSLFDVMCAEGTQVLHILVPETRLRERGIRVRPARFRLEGPRTLRSPLLALARELVAPGWEPTETALRIAERAVEDLAVGMLVEWEDHDLDRDDLRAQLRRRAIDEVAQRHRDPDLSPAVLARRLGVSLRHLQRAFEGSGTTAKDQITRHRTASAESLLLTPGGRALNVSEVARATGFSSAFELRSAFRARYGVLPSEYRLGQYVNAPQSGESPANETVSGSALAAEDA